MSVRITAKKTSPCACGRFVHSGDSILWNPVTRKTEACPACEADVPDPDPFNGYSEGFGPDDYPIFHEDW